jgi:hypothetical protein
MTETPNRRTASTAAREFLQTKVDRIGDLAEAARAIDAAVEARAAADRHITDCQRAYADVRRAALTAGWTADELDQLGWAVEHGTQPACRRRSAGRPSQPPATATAALEPAPGGAGAVTATSAERDSATSSAEPSDALPDGSGPDEAPVHGAVPVKYPDPQPVG